MCGGGGPYKFVCVGGGGVPIKKNVALGILLRSLDFWKRPSTLTPQTLDCKPFSNRDPVTAVGSSYRIQGKEGGHEMPGCLSLKVQHKRFIIKVAFCFPQLSYGV